MKKTFIVLGAVTFLTACGGKYHGSGAVEPTYSAVDTSSYLPSAKDEPANPKTDSTKMEDREDLQSRPLPDTAHQDTTHKDTTQKK